MVKAREGMKELEEGKVKDKEGVRRRGGMVGGR